MKETVSNPVTILRWILVLPGALLGVIIAMFPIHWLNMLLYYAANSDIDSFITIKGKSPLAALIDAVSLKAIEAFLNAIFCPLVMIEVGSRIAPTKKFETAVCLAILSVATMLTLCVFVIVTTGVWIQPTITIALAIWGNYGGVLRAQDHKPSIKMLKDPAKDTSS